MAATHVSAVMNSYMSPHGARCTANPLVVTAITCARMPTALSVAAARTHGPASAIARSAPAGRTGRAVAPAIGLPGPAAAAAAPGAAAFDPGPRASFDSCASDSGPSSTTPAGAALAGAAPTVA